ncbi:MAG: redox-regulated ATPase YchF [Anaerolineae bacterium]|nr:redox-regulated ATPase YchF [Anaerolineae bacterium]
MEIGIIGLPTSGKTTVFNALTGSDRETSAASTGKLELHSATVNVPDDRIDQLSTLYKPRKTIYAQVVFTDIAGLDKDLGKKGLSGELRNKIAPMDAFIHVVRAFEDNRIPHLAQSVNPARDLNNLDTEFLLADMVTAETRLARIAERLSKGAKAEERQKLIEDQALFNRLLEALSDGTHLRDVDLTEEELNGISGYSFLTLKPVLVLINTGEDDSEQVDIQYKHRHSDVLSMQAKLEMEISQLAEDEVTFFMDEFGITDRAVNRVIQAAYKLVNLQSFFTVGEDEVRAWTLPVGATALEAAGAIHSDLARGFIRAEVIPYKTLIKAGDMVAARKAGQVQIEGKTYVIHDGEIVHIRFSV